MNVIIRGKSLEHLVEGRDESREIARNTLRSVDILRLVGSLGLGVEGCHELKYERAQKVEPTHPIKKDTTKDTTFDTIQILSNKSSPKEKNINHGASETLSRYFLYTDEGRKAFAWRHDRNTKGVNVIIRGKSWAHLVKGRDESNGSLGLGVEGCHELKHGRAKR